MTHELVNHSYMYVQLCGHPCMENGWQSCYIIIAAHAFSAGIKFPHCSIIDFGYLGKIVGFIHS